MSEVKTEPRRLVDLNPKWVETTDGKVYGIEYDCPCRLPAFEPLLDADGHVQVRDDKKVVGVVPYAQCCPRGAREVVPTKNNWLGQPVPAVSVEKGWSLTGDSFENVTLSPSIHAVGHWHGHLLNGVLVSC